MSYLSGWISQLVLIVLFAVILEILLPSGGFQKYVKLVVGLVLIVVLLDPVMKLFQIDPGL
ncbi:stage III sporulation protein AF [Sporolactobacillus sp. Y61]|uniref:Stage III sporulation protein AF n=1 Tax=Sporolactobacillus sp. Y61 TaxID=3160863 RepID=A0AAU8IDZ1_9BACL